MSSRPPGALWFYLNCRLGIQTQASDPAPFQNNLMRAANPETREIKRFFVGTVGCEVTGVVSTPDVKTMFVNIQHPEANWPDANDPRLRGVRGVNFEPGNIMKVTTHLARHKTDRQRQAVLFEGGRHAVTRVRIVEPFGDPAVASLVECWLETGRTHQIRVHMAHAGHGLIGDPVYGGRRKLGEKAIGVKGAAAAKAFARQALHAAVLGFEHPVTGEDLRFEAPLPEDMAQLIADLGGQ